MEMICYKSYSTKHRLWYIVLDSDIFGLAINNDHMMTSWQGSLWYWHFVCGVGWEWVVEIHQSPVD